MSRIDITNENEIYNRLLENKPYGKNLKPYSINILKKTIELFIENEEYEKCIFIEEIIKNRNNSQIFFYQ